MKRIITSLLILVMLTSLAACATPTAETTVSEKPAQMEATTPSPTVEPTATPEPTPSPTPELTEAEKMMDIWLESTKNEKGDIYANLVATKAYYDGEFYDLIKEGKYNEGDIHTLIVSNNLYKSYYYPVSDNVLSENYNVDNLSPADLVIAILRGDDVKATGEQLKEAFYALEGLMADGFSLVSALPEDLRDEVYELIDDINDMIFYKKDVTDLVKTISSYDLEWRQKWYITEYCVSWPGMSPYVTCDGKGIQLVEYINNTEAISMYALEIQDIFAQSYLHDAANDRVDLFNLG